MWRCRKIRVIFTTKQKETNMSETENTKDEDKENKSMKGNPEALPLKRNKPVSPQRLPNKTGCSHDVYLPTHEKSQAKYEKFLCTSNRMVK